jgi:hypothetical protein
MSTNIESKVYKSEEEYIIKSIERTIKGKSDHKTLLSCLEYIIFISDKYPEILNNETILLYILAMRELVAANYPGEDNNPAYHITFSLFIKLYANKFKDVSNIYHNRKTIIVSTQKDSTLVSVHLKDLMNREAKFSYNISEPSSSTCNETITYLGCMSFSDRETNCVHRSTKTNYSIKYISNNLFDKVYDAYMISPEKAVEVWLNV